MFIGYPQEDVIQLLLGLLPVNFCMANMEPSIARHLPRANYFLGLVPCDSCTANMEPSAKHPTTMGSVTYSTLH